MVFKRVTYVVKLSNGDTLFAESREKLLHRLDMEILFWTKALKVERKKTRKSTFKNLITMYNAAFKEVFNYKD